MPIMDGVEATSKIRLYLHSQCIPREVQPKIIGVTGHVLKTFTNEGMKAGMDEVVAKPMYTDILEEILRKYAS